MNRKKTYGIGPDGILSECRAKNPETCKFHVRGSHQKITQRQFESRNEELIRQSSTPASLKRPSVGSGNSSRVSPDVYLRPVEGVDDKGEFGSYEYDAENGTLRARRVWRELDFRHGRGNDSVEVYVDLPVITDAYPLDAKVPEIVRHEDGSARLKLYFDSSNYSNALLQYGENGYGDGVLQDPGRPMLEVDLDESQSLGEQMAYAKSIADDPSPLLEKMRGGAGYPAASGGDHTYYVDGARETELKIPESGDPIYLTAEVRNYKTGVTRRFITPADDPVPLHTIPNLYIVDAEPGDWGRFTLQRGTRNPSKIYAIRPRGSEDRMIEIGEMADGRWMAFSYANVDEMISAVCAGNHESAGLWTEMADEDAGDHRDDSGLDGGGRLDGLGFTDAVTTRFGGRHSLSWSSAEEAKQAINELVASGRDRMLL